MDALDKVIGLVIAGIFMGATFYTVLNEFQTASLVSASTAVASLYLLLPVMFIIAGVLALYGYVRSHK